MALAIQLSPHEDQTEFNLKCWEKILADPKLVKLNQRIESDRHGNIIVTPPPMASVPSTSPRPPTNGSKNHSRRTRRQPPDHDGPKMGIRNQ